MFYKVVVEYGHLGSGRGCEITRFVKGENALKVFLKTKTMPRAKKGPTSIKLLSEVSREEYVKGVSAFEQLSLNSPYFAR